jgi:hypothetical protein
MRRHLLDKKVLLHVFNRAVGHEHIARRLASSNAQEIPVSAITA